MPELILDWQLNTQFPERDVLYALGIIPTFILADDPRPAHEQINERYAHGGGWNPMLPSKWKMDQDDNLFYPGDPPMQPLAMAYHGEERIIVYPYAFVAIVTGEAFSVARLD